MTSRTGSATTLFPVQFNGNRYNPQTLVDGGGETGLTRAKRADRLLPTGRTISYRKYYDDFSAISIDNVWSDVSGGITSRADPKVYVVQTSTSIVERCILMTTDPGDLVLDPTCGSGTTAYVAEQWGRRWITIDTSRVAIALARSRLMGARYRYYLLADSPEGQHKEAEITRSVPKTTTNSQRYPDGVRLWARAAHHAQVDRQQRRDRRDLGTNAALGGRRHRRA